jgi:chromosome segregation ATPase
MKLKPIRGFGRKRKQLEQELQETREILQQTIDNFTSEIQGYNDTCWKWLCEVSKAHEERDKALKKIDKQKEQIKDLEEQLKELQSNRYLVRKVPEGRKPKGQVIRSKGSNVTSKIIKKIKED